MNTAMLLQIVQPIAVIVAALSILTGLRGVQKQIRVTTYLEFTKRFGEVYTPLEKALRKYGKSISLDMIHADEAEYLRELVSTYLGLIAAEYHFQRDGNIDKETWSMWSGGMSDTVKNPLFQEVWREIGPRFVAIRGFQRFIDDKIAKANARFRS